MEENQSISETGYGWVIVLQMELEMCVLFKSEIVAVDVITAEKTTITVLETGLLTAAIW